MFLQSNVSAKLFLDEYVFTCEASMTAIEDALIGNIIIPQMVDTVFIIISLNLSNNVSAKNEILRAKAIK